MRDHRRSWHVYAIPKFTISIEIIKKRAFVDTYDF